MRKSLGLIALLVGLAACGKSDNDTPSSIPQTSVKSEANNYSKTADLNLAQTNGDLRLVKSNAVFLKGTGSKSAYKIFYRFNSGDHNSFKVIETSLSSRYSNCSAPEPKLTLKGLNLAREISLLDQVTIQPNSDYVLEVEAAHDCGTLDMTYDVIAWIGTSVIKPRVALICTGQHMMQTTFVMSVNFVTAFSTVTGRDKFLGMDTYCGEEFKNANKTECSASANLLLANEGSAWSHVQCVAERDSLSRAYLIDFDMANERATLTCKSGNIQTYSETFQSCRPVLVDYAQYDQL